MNVITPYLVRVHHIPYTSPIIKQFSQQLQTCLHQQYMTPISYLNAYRTRKELNLVKSIRYRLKKEKLILRVTEKAEAYRQKTDAYMELETNPLAIVYDKVVHLLHDLRSKEHIKAWQLNKMLPKRDDVELAYLYFLPKPHKVNFKFEFFNVYDSHLYLLCCILSGRNSIETNCLINEDANNSCFKIS